MFDQLAQFMQGIEYWHWFGLMLVMIIMELLLPGAIFLWMAVGAAIVGVCMLIWQDMSWDIQFYVFGFSSLFSAVFWRMYRHKFPEYNSHPHLNRRSDKYMNRVYVLVQPINNGTGSVKIEDSMWRVAGPEAETGAKVRVIGIDGATLQVELVNEQPTIDSV